MHPDSKNRKYEASALVRKLSRSAFSISAWVFALVMLLIYLLATTVIVTTVIANSQTEVNDASALIETELKNAQTILENSPNPVVDGNAEGIVENIVLHNVSVCGSAVALSPEQAREQGEGDFSMVYAWRKLGEARVRVKHLGDSTDYDYTTMEWYSVPMREGKAHWSEPYYDRGGGDMLMCTYSIPVPDADNRNAGVITIDIALDEGIARIVDQINSRLHSEESDNTFYLLSNEGHLLAGDTVNTGKHDLICKSPVEGTGWTLYRSVGLRNFVKPALIALMVALLFYAITIVTVRLSNNFFLNRLAKPEVQNRMRLIGELDTASRIQQGMLPKSGTATGIVDAVMTPAKEVGGDFYNYFLDGERLYFIIADVSGKGMPAALIMALASKLFTVNAPGMSDAARIVEKLNGQLSRDNEAAMFATMIVGILDLRTRQVQLCNAGHNPPYLLSGSEVKRLSLPENCPVGLFENFDYSEVTLPMAPGSCLVLYTDGVTEAENSAKEQFGEDRLGSILAARPENLCSAVETAVHDFAGGAEQSDDITVMTIRVPDTKLMLRNRLEDFDSVRSEIESLALRPEEEMKLCLAVEEAFVNVVNYSDASRIEVEIKRCRDEIVITIADDGKAFDPLQVETVLPDADDPVPGGLGIHLVRNLMDRVDYRRTDGRNILTLTKKTNISNNGNKN